MGNEMNTNVTYTYNDLEKKYAGFCYPMIKLLIGEKDFGENKHQFVVSDIEIELSVGVEASVATFHYYHCYDIKNKTYLINDIKPYITLGSSVCIQIGYADIYTEVFCGFISQVEFVCDAVNSHHIEVTAMDAKGLMMSNSSARQMQAASFGEALKELFQSPIYQKMQSNGILKGIEVEDTPDKEESNNKPTSYSIEMVSESDYEFVVKAAKRFHYEFYIDNGVIYFRKAKDEEESCLMEIGIEQGLIYYQIGYDITSLVKEVEVRGMDIGNGKVIGAKVKASNKISIGNRAKALISQSSKVYIDANAVTKKAAELRAEAIMKDISYRFGTLNCECIGIPEIKPGYRIRTKGLTEPADNEFYITNVRHVMSDDKHFQTMITAKAATMK